MKYILALACCDMSTRGKCLTGCLSVAIATAVHCCSYALPSAAVMQASIVYIISSGAPPLKSTHVTVLPGVWGLPFLCKLVRGRQQQKSGDGAK